MKFLIGLVLMFFGIAGMTYDVAIGLLVAIVGSCLSIWGELGREYYPEERC